MKKYKCSKEVHAEPIDRCGHNTFEGWTTQNNDKYCDEGYLIIYNKDTDDQYVTWIPKKQFDESYICIDNYKQRMQLEFDELKERFLKLQSFMLSEKFSELNRKECSLLDSQKYSMEQYCSSLFRQIYGEIENTDCEVPVSDFPER